jgi:hypothetical protein
MGGFFGMQGPPAVLYFIQSEPTKEYYMAMAQTYFLIGNVMMTGVRAYNGFFTETVAVDYLYGLGASSSARCWVPTSSNISPTAFSATSSMPISASVV